MGKYCAILSHSSDCPENHLPESIEQDDFFRYTGAIDGSTQAVIETTRAKFVEAELALRDLWYDTVEQSPNLAARVNSAARFAHLAADALATETLL